MKRRDLVVGLGSAVAWPVVVRAQQAAMPVIGFMSSRAAEESKYLVAAFRQGLREVGFTESQNVAIEFRWANGQYDSLAPLGERLPRPARREGHRV